MDREPDQEAYDGWGNHPGRFRVQVGNSAGNSATKLIWWLLGIVAVAGIAEAGWLGNAVIDLKAEVAALNAKVDFLIVDRRNARP